MILYVPLRMARLDLLSDISLIFERANALTPLGLMAVVVLSIVGLAWIGQRITRSMNSITERQIEAMRAERAAENQIQTALLDYITKLSENIGRMADATQNHERMLAVKMDLFADKLSGMSDAQLSIVSLMENLHADNREANQAISKQSESLTRLDKGMAGLTTAITDVAEKLEQILSDHRAEVKDHYNTLDILFARLEQNLSGLRMTVQTIEAVAKNTQRLIEAQDVKTKPLPDLSKKQQEPESDGSNYSEP